MKFSFTASWLTTYTESDVACRLPTFPTRQAGGERRFATRDGAAIRIPEHLCQQLISNR